MAVERKTLTWDSEGRLVEAPPPLIAPELPASLWPPGADSRVLHGPELKAYRRRRFAESCHAFLRFSWAPQFREGIHGPFSAVLTIATFALMAAIYLVAAPFVWLAMVLARR